MFTPLKHVTCHMSRVTCHMSRVKCFFFVFFTKWWSLSVEGLLSTGPTLSSLCSFTAWKVSVLHCHCHCLFVLLMSHSRVNNFGNFVKSTIYSTFKLYNLKKKYPPPPQKRSILVHTGQDQLVGLISRIFMTGELKHKDPYQIMTFAALRICSTAGVSVVPDGCPL